MTGKQAGKGALVMIVDDDVAVLGAMERLMTDWGYTTVGFKDFKQAQDALRSGYDPDVLMVDVRLGAFNGLQLILLAKDLRPVTRGIAMSGFEDPVLREEAKTAGAAFLLKPLNFAELRRLLPTD